MKLHRAAILEALFYLIINLSLYLTLRQLAQHEDLTLIFKITRALFVTGIVFQILRALGKVEPFYVNKWK